MGNGKWQHSLVFVNNCVYAIGGRSNGADLTDVEMHSLDKDKWVGLPDLPVSFGAT